MISPHTPPGTKVICIDACGEFPDVEPLVEGETYTVRRIGVGLIRGFPAFGCFLEEIINGKAVTGREWSYGLRRFRLPVTLDTLTAVPSQAPVDLDKGAPSPRKRVRA